LKHGHSAKYKKENVKQNELSVVKVEDFCHGLLQPLTFLVYEN